MCNLICLDVANAYIFFTVNVCVCIYVLPRMNCLHPNVPNNISIQRQEVRFVRGLRAPWIRSFHSGRSRLTGVNDWKGQGNVSVLVDQGARTPASDEEPSLKEYTSTSVRSQQSSVPN